MGRYMPQSEIDRTAEYEIRIMAQRLSYLRGDLSDDAKKQNLLPLISLACSAGGYPETEKQLAALLKEPDSLQRLADEMRSFAAAYEENRDILRFHFHHPKEMLSQLEDLQREPILFRASEDYDPKRRFFISLDEIDKHLQRGGTDYRLGVYAFFLAHADTQDRERYVRSHHGEYSGFTSGNDSGTYTSKGFMFSHGSMSEPYAKIEWSWNKVVKRIDTMIRQGRFLSDEDRAAMQEYEHKQLARLIHGAFFDVPEAQPRPYSVNPIGSYWEGVQEVQEQLTDSVKVEEIRQMLVSVADDTKPEERYYNARQEALVTLTAYINGEYSLFGEKHEPLSLPESAEENMAQQAASSDLEETIALINAYCQEEFESDADFTDLSHVDLAFSSTGDHEHTIEVYADLVNYRIIYAVDGETVYTNACDSLSELNDYLIKQNGSINSHR